MDRSALRKERKRLKRQRKREELERKRTEGRSPSAVLSEARGPTVCYINENWRECRSASLLVMKGLRSGRWALGAFLVDLTCCGLKDCWGRLEISRRERDDVLGAPADMGFEYEPFDLEAARRLVAGAIRFTRQNRLRLPSRYERWAAMLGITGFDPQADLTGFGRDGDPSKLMYIGARAHLEHRLIGESLRDFIERTGLQFIFGPGPGEPLDFAGRPEVKYVEPEDLDGEEAGDAEDDDVLEEGFQLTHARLLEGTRRWCFENGAAPHSLLPEAVDVLLAALAEVDLGDGDPEDAADAYARLLDHALELQGEKPASELEPALAQVQGFMQSLESKGELIAALGLADEGEG
ncbi:MAG: hypothetical protein HY721_05520 [Planctomycetes bacterium]|nr:hypothetical protein [Planctomycetota bacterium]